MRDKLASLIEDGVYELVTLTVSAAALSGKWVLKIKRGAQGEIEPFKARYVVREFSEKTSIRHGRQWGITPR